ncbi:MAG: exosortase/archaeosortase family protein [Verrucomicrobiae bacterium]|nr:exosortase/archaeosortase family protein [Verrucomicrobiae bacterium]
MKSVPAGLPASSAVATAGRESGGIGVDLGWLLGLGGAAAWIWLRDRTWMDSSAATLPALSALPLFAWLGRPWHRSPDAGAVSFPRLGAACGLWLSGLLFDVTLLLTLAWTTALSAWLRSRLSASDWADRRPLLLLPFLAFPWVALDAAGVGWWFRLSAAALTQWLFAAIGCGVERRGTLLLIDDTSVAVDASCSGLNVLQALLIGGALAAFLLPGARLPLRWLGPLLAGLAWFSNCLRVILLTGVAVFCGPELARGWFHSAGGWLVLMVMFLLTLKILKWLQGRQRAGLTGPAREVSG